MTPAEHYREAEQLLGQAETQAKRRQGAPAGQIAGLAALAQVHATLALVPEGRAVLAAEEPGHAGVDGERPIREQTAGEAGLTSGTRSDGDAARWTP